MGYVSPKYHPLGPRYRYTSEGAEKCCYRCKKWLPADVQFFHRNRTTNDGMHYWCKACCQFYSRRGFAERRQVLRERAALLEKQPFSPPYAMWAVYVLLPDPPAPRKVTFA